MLQGGRAGGQRSACSTGRGWAAHPCSGPAAAPDPARRSSRAARPVVAVGLPLDRCPVAAAIQPACRGASPNTGAPSAAAATTPSFGLHIGAAASQVTSHVSHWHLANTMYGNRHVYLGRVEQCTPDRGVARWWIPGRTAATHACSGPAAAPSRARAWRGCFWRTLLYRKIQRRRGPLPVDDARHRGAVNVCGGSISGSCGVWSLRRLHLGLVHTQLASPPVHRPQVEAPSTSWHSVSLHTARSAFHL